MAWILVLLALLCACGDDGGATSDAMTDTPLVDVMLDAPDPNNPLTLMDTGLCGDAACTQINAGIVEYKPRFELWSDTADKRRWIYLPPGSQIDTSDMDYWKFPVGTKLWKEFARGGVRVETRLVMRTGAGDNMSDWFYVAYVWNQTQDATTAVPFGMNDANGTLHDVPSRAMCRGCHENLKPSRVLGFGAIQLDWDNPTAGELDLAELVTGGKLTQPPTISSSPPYYFPLPGNLTYEQPALGYLQANCAHCHNPSSMAINNTPLVVRLTVGSLGSLATTSPYVTAVGITSTNSVGGLTKIIEPTMPAQSILMYRFESTNPAHRMPALGTEMMDPTGQTVLRDWIMNIQ